MNDERIPQTPRSWYAYIGKKGGSAKTPAQLEAQKKNLARAREIRLERLRASNPPTK